MIRASVESPTQPRDEDVQRAAAVDRPGKHLVARCLFDRQRLAGHRRLVDVAVARPSRAPSSGIFSPGRTSTCRRRHVVDRHAHARAPSRRTSASAGARSMSARIAPRARSIARASSSWASAKRNTTDAASVHSPRTIAPPTATTIRTLMSRRRRASETRARRDGEDAAERRSSRANGIQAAEPDDAQRAASEAGGKRTPDADDQPLPRTRRRRDRRRLLVLEPRAHPRLRDRFRDRCRRQLRGVVLDAQALADDVRVERFETRKPLQACSRIATSS